MSDNIHGAMAASLLSEVLLCATCGAPMRLDVARARASCCHSNGHRLDRSILRYDPNLADSEKPEMRARDRQAHGYMMHSKFPTQIHRIRSFVAGLPEGARALPVLDLGCGPGPTTAILLAAGFRVIAIDFSLTSLELNKEQCRDLGDVLYVHADLTQIKFAERRAGGLMMADFLQHLGGPDRQKSVPLQGFRGVASRGVVFSQLL
jgi:2-polyprenyl-3-methyl-5-hydroxy-6-metoxy-1,4-benzoquinol methylase